MLKDTGISLAAIYAALNSGCVTTRLGKPFIIKPEQRKRVEYPLLTGGAHKVQPPRNGCYIGLHVISHANWKSKKPRVYKGDYKWIEEKFGKGPKIIIPNFGYQRNVYQAGQWGGPESPLLVPENLLVDKRSVTFLIKDIMYY